MNHKQRKFAQHGGQARVLAIVAARLALSARRTMLYTYAILVALASFVFFGPFQTLAAGQTVANQFGIGVSPAGMNTSNLPQSQVIHYDKNFIKNLKANTPFVRCCERRELPEMSGNQHRLYMYQALGANISQVGEGVVGSPITVSVLNTTATIGQYADYVNISDLARMTAIDPALENIQKELAYRLGLSLSTLARNVADGASVIDSSVNANSKAFNVPFGKNDVTTNVQSLAGRNVMPFDKGKFCGIIHPFIVGDTLNDNTNNSLSDILKHTIEGQMKLEELPSPDADEVQVMDWAGATFYQSTIVTQTSNYQSSGKTALRTYLFGEDGLIAISLGKKEQAQIGDGDWRNLKLWMYKSDEPSPSDPSRVIGGWTSYNVKFVVTLPPDVTMRLRYIDAVSNVS